MIVLTEEKKMKHLKIKLQGKGEVRIDLSVIICIAIIVVVFPQWEFLLVAVFTSFDANYFCCCFPQWGFLMDTVVAGFETIATANKDVWRCEIVPTCVKSIKVVKSCNSMWKHVNNFKICENMRSSCTSWSNPAVTICVGLVKRAKCGFAYQ